MKPVNFNGSVLSPHKRRDNLSQRSPEKVNEVILAEEQSVVSKTERSTEVQGTLALTNSRLVFAVAQEEEDVAEYGARLGSHPTLRFSDINDLNSVAPNPVNLSIPLSSIISVTGHKGEIGLPNLKVRWRDDLWGTKNAEFSQQVISRERKKTLMIGHR
jgi:hypothetical protein